jgi:hypothetical protein
MNCHSEEPGDPSQQNAPRSTGGGTKLKIIKPPVGKVFQKTNINKLFFGFLKIENIRKLHLSLSFSPRTFQHKIFQDLFIIRQHKKEKSKM